jgi:NitT/TauT family transport system ATP-binding protein
MTNINFTDTTLPNIIELKNVNQTYDGGKSFVIKDLNLLIEDKPAQGQFVVILGVSGCGKSTILRYIAGLQKPSSGEVYIQSKLQTGDTKIGMIFQKYSSLPWMNVLDNVALGLEFKGIAKKERYERAMEMIKTVELTGHEKKYAKYPTLSGGQLQRVAIARSLLSNPDILLMDEPFGALDINTRLKMQDLLAQMWDKLETTIVFVTHDISEAVYLGDEIWIMSSNPGQIVNRIEIDLPFHRDRSIKRTSKFVELVYRIEDEMMNLEKKTV